MPEAPKPVVRKMTFKDEEARPVTSSKLVNEKDPLNPSRTRYRFEGGRLDGFELAAFGFLLDPNMEINSQNAPGRLGKGVSVQLVKGKKAAVTHYGVQFMPDADCGVISICVQDVEIVQMLAPLLEERLRELFA